jgi:hypothetical protein
LFSTPPARNIFSFWKMNETTGTDPRQNSFFKLPSLAIQAISEISFAAIFPLILH